jgi:hypothetical protein
VADPNLNAVWASLLGRVAQPPQQPQGPSNVWQAILGVANQGLQGVAQGLEQQGNPQVYAQAQENARLQKQLDFQQMLRSTLTPGEALNAGLQLQLHRDTLAQQGVLNDQHADQLIATGQGREVAEGTPGATKMGSRWIAPVAPIYHTIKWDSPIGKVMGLGQGEDLTRLTDSEVLQHAGPFMEKLIASEEPTGSQLRLSGCPNGW